MDTHIDDFPEDVLKTATAAWFSPVKKNGVRLVALAILEERERCAKVAEAWETVIPMWDRPGGPPGNGPMRAGTPHEIAAAIRKGEA